MGGKVSVIVPVYKDDWIEQCLESIYRQTYQNYELIRIDDPEGLGVSQARNRGLEQATGDYVAFCDADDYMEPDALEKMVAAIENVDMVLGGFRKFGAFESVVQHPEATLGMREVAAYAMQNLRNPRDRQLLSGCWAKLYKRHMVGTFPNLTTAEDMAFNFDYLSKCYKVAILPDVVYNNRKHDGSLSTTFDEKNKGGLFGFMRALRSVKHFLKPFYSDSEIDDAVDNSKAYHSILYFQRICAQNGGSLRDNFMRLYQ